MVHASTGLTIADLAPWRRSTFATSKHCHAHRPTRTDPHAAGRDLPRRADRRVVLDPAAVPRRRDLGHDDRRRHLAGDAVAAGPAVAAPGAGRRGHDGDPAAGVRGAAGAGHRHDRAERRRDRRAAEVARRLSHADAAGLDCRAAVRRCEGRPGVGAGGGFGRRGPAGEADAVRRQRDEVVRRRGRQRRLPVRAVPAHARARRADVCAWRSRRAGGAALRPPPGRRARRERGAARRPGDPQRGARRGRHGGRAVRAGRHRPGDRRRAVRRAAHRGDVLPVHRADRAVAGAGSGGDLALLERRDGLGHGPARVVA